MAGKRAWETEHGLFAYFYSKEHPSALGVREISDRLQKEYGASYSKSTVSNMIASVSGLLATDEATKESYEKFKTEQAGAKYFWKYDADGKIESPYESVRRKVAHVFAKKGYYSDNLLAQLRAAEKFWVFVGRKKPDDWKEDDLNRYLPTLKQGSKFSATVGIRQFSKTLKDIDGATDGLKGEARMPSVLKLKEFPKIFQDLQKKVLEITPEEQRGEMEFIVRVKPAVGIRTGKNSRGKGLWGTKIGAPWKNQYGKNASHIQVIGNSLIWHVLEKRDEEWEINFMTDELRAYIINFVKAKQRAGAKWLLEKVTEVEANNILGNACELMGIERLRLHDMRKIGITFLNRAGVPLEKAITVNVGWKDIATAFKHYLALANMGEKEQEFKDKLGTLYSGGVQASKDARKEEVEA